MVAENEKWMYWKASNMSAEGKSLKRIAKTLGVDKPRAQSLLDQIQSNFKREAANRASRKRRFPTLEFWNDLRQGESKSGHKYVYFKYKGWMILPSRDRSGKLCKLKCSGARTQWWEDPLWHKDFDSAKLALFEWLNPPEGFRESLRSSHARQYM